MFSGVFEISLLVLLLAFALLILYMAITEMMNFMQTRVPFVPTSRIDIADMAERVGITNADYFYDIGSGNGKVVFTVENLTGARAKGLQRSGWTQSYAKFRGWLTGSKSELVSGNFFDQPWHEATVIYAYLYPFLMNQVAEKAAADCKPGTKLVVRDFKISSLRHHETWQTPSNHTMYLYII
jgi:hypothetical protein